MSTTQDHTAIELRDGYAEIGDQHLHYVEAGEGPLIVLLHGFPEFWYGWRLQIQPLAAAGFRVVAPDMRGYNLSSKPDGVAAYNTDRLVADIRGLIQERGAESAQLVGHDWGGTVAWVTAMNHPEVVDRLAILNAAHPRKLSQGLHHPGQLRKSWYFFFFDLPELPESVVHANHWHFFRHFLHDGFWQVREVEEEEVPGPAELGRVVQSLRELPRVGRVEDSQPVHDLGMVHREGPGDGSAPVMPDQQRGLGAAFVDQAADVVDQRADVVGRDAVRS